MRAWQYVDLAADRADVGQAASVEATSLRDDCLAHDVLLGLVEESTRGLGGVAAGADRGQYLVARGVEGRVALVLTRLGERGLEARERGLAYAAVEVGVDGWRLHAALRLAATLAELVLEREQWLQCLVGTEEGLEQRGLGKHARPALDHDDGVTASRHDDVDVGFGETRRDRVDHELPADAADPHGG